MDFEEKMQAYADAQKDTLVRNDTIDDALFREKHVYRGLRDLNGKGVVTGLTNIKDRRGQRGKWRADSL